MKEIFSCRDSFINIDDYNVIWQGVFNYILIIGYGADAVAAHTISGRLDMLVFLHNGHCHV